MMKSYAIIGTGAVGGLYGALLQRSGKEVHFLLHSDYAHVREHGLRVETPAGEFTLAKVNAYAAAEAMPRCDVAVLAWKTTANSHLHEVLPKVVKPGGVVLVLQNGLDPEREAAAAFANAKTEANIIGGLCFLCARKDGPGWIRHLDYGAITLAAFAPDDFGVSGAGDVAVAAGAPVKVTSEVLGVTPEIRAIAEDFRAAGVDIRVQDDWRTARWRKLVWNVPFNGLCALLDADTHALMRFAPTRELLKGMMEEVVAGARACGCALPDTFVERMLSDTDAMKPYEPSMKLDRDAGRPMELEAIYARPIEEMEKRGVPAPRMKALLAQLRFLEEGSRTQ